MYNYVLGFLIDNNKENVILIRKTKPTWQAGALNGVGGKIEDNEYPKDAMVREFFEETGASIINWENYCTMSIRDFSIHCYYSFADQKILNQCFSKTFDENGEKVGQYKINDIINRKEIIIDNLPWLLSMIVSHDLGDSRHYEVKYS